jgi:hypothetical protein
MVTAQPQIVMNSVLWYEEIFVKTSLNIIKGLHNGLCLKTPYEANYLKSPMSKWA